MEAWHIFWFDGLMRVVNVSLDDFDTKEDAFWAIMFWKQVRDLEYKIVFCWPIEYLAMRFDVRYRPVYWDGREIGYPFRRVGWISMEELTWENHLKRK